MPHLYQDLPPLSGYGQSNKYPGKLDDEINSGPHGHHNMDLNISTSMIPSFGSKLGLLLPDPAPDVSPNKDKPISTASTAFGVMQQSKNYQIFLRNVHFIL